MVVNYALRSERIMVKTQADRIFKSSSSWLLLALSAWVSPFQSTQNQENEAEKTPQ
jgi:hypothetical protein